MILLNNKLNDYLYICIFLASLEELDLSDDDIIPNIYLKNIQIQNSDTIKAVAITFLFTFIRANQYIGKNSTAE